MKELQRLMKKANGTGINNPLSMNNKYFIAHTLGRLANKGEIKIDFTGENDIFLLTVSPSKKMYRRKISFQPINIWVERNYYFRILRAVRKKALRTGK